MRGSRRPTARFRVSAQHVDEFGLRPSTHGLDRFVAYTGVVAALEFGDERPVRRRPQDVPDLVRFRNRVQIGGRRGVAGGLCGQSRDFRRRILRSPVRRKRRSPLQRGSLCTADELPRRLDGCARPLITGQRSLEDRQYFCSPLRGITHDDAQVVVGQLEVCHRPNASSLAERRPARRPVGSGGRSAVRRSETPESPRRACQEIRRISVALFT